jgi:uncharacterized membrane protein
MASALPREIATVTAQGRGPTGDLDGEAEFRFVMTPHRSLSDRAFLVFILSVLAVAVAAQLYFVVIGVWVAAIAALFDGLFLVGAFIACRRDRRRTEVLQFKDGTLRSMRYRGNGEIISDVEVPAFGLAMCRKIDDEYGCLRLELIQNGRRFEVASELSPVERSSLADAVVSELRSRGLGVRIETA